MSYPSPVEFAEQARHLTETYEQVWAERARQAGMLEGARTRDADYATLLDAACAWRDARADPARGPSPMPETGQLADVVDELSPPTPRPAEVSRWNHVLCDACWQVRCPDRIPVTVRGEQQERCCGCGQQTTSGIWIRDNPAVMSCEGAGTDTVHWERP